MSLPHALAYKATGGAGRGEPALEGGGWADNWLGKGTGKSLVVDRIGVEVNSTGGGSRVRSQAEDGA